MKVTVTPRNAFGKPLSQKAREDRPAFTGTLEISEQSSVALDRVVPVAKLIDSSAPLKKRSVLELHDTVMLWLADYAMGLRGVEIIDGAQYAQAWVVVIDQESLTAGKRNKRQTSGYSRPRFTTQYLLTHFNPTLHEHTGRLVRRAKPQLRLVWPTPTQR
jgi:hypothetical protein